MPQGLQIFDSNGNMTLDVTDRLTRILGEFQTGTVDGSITDSALSYGMPWIINVDEFQDWVTTAVPITFSFGINTISWHFEPAYSYLPRRNMKIMYGVY